jgi:DNA-binding YbaB/EbfC family protein
LLSLMKHARQLGGKVQDLTEQLKRQRVVGAAGGGMVEVEVNGLHEFLACRIQPELWQRGDREMVEDLLVAAANQALTRARDLWAESLNSVAGDMPGWDTALSQLLAGTADDQDDAADTADNDPLRTDERPEDDRSTRT